MIYKLCLGKFQTDSNGHELLYNNSLHCIAGRNYCKQLIAKCNFVIPMNRGGIRGVTLKDISIKPTRICLSSSYALSERRISPLNEHKRI